MKDRVQMVVPLFDVPDSHCLYLHNAKMAKMKQILVKSWHTISCLWADKVSCFLMLIQLNEKLKSKILPAYLQGTWRYNINTTFLFGKSAVQNGKVVKIPGWTRKEPTLRSILSKKYTIKKNPIDEILDISFKIWLVNSS